MRKTLYLKFLLAYLIFGFFGFILGPLGLLLVEDLVGEWERGQRKQASDSLTKQQFWRKIER